MFTTGHHKLGFTDVHLCSVFREQANKDTHSDSDTHIHNTLWVRSLLPRMTAKWNIISTRDPTIPTALNFRDITSAVLTVAMYVNFNRWKTCHKMCEEVYELFHIKFDISSFFTWKGNISRCRHVVIQKYHLQKRDIFRRPGTTV
jgi:hypothetical protein